MSGVFICDFVVNEIWIEMVQGTARLRMAVPVVHCREVYDFQAKDLGPFKFVTDIKGQRIFEAMPWGAQSSPSGNPLALLRVVGPVSSHA